MNKKIRILAAALSTLMLLASCGQKPGAESGRTEQSGAGEGKLFTAPTELDLVITSHVSWPYNENWEVWKYFKEATGAEFNIQAIPGADLETKLPLMMASPESLPDLIYMYAKSQVDAHALSGAFVSLDDRMEEMPNYRAFLESLPEETAEELVRQRTSGDGKVYSAPCYGTQTVTNLRTWLYREDIFKKHKLKAPETFEELYQVCKKLKELYPESYPLCFREGLFKLEDIGPSWQSYFSYLPYYDFDAEEWRCGAQEPVMKEIVEYFLKLKKEDLVPPNYTTIETKSWEELMSTDRGFITFDYVVRIDFFNTPNRQTNPEYTLTMMAPPKPDVATGSQRLNKTNLDFSGYSICNTGKEERIRNAVKLVDWMYTDEAQELLSWGKEGETYKEEKGKRTYILEEGEQPQTRYGFATSGTYQRMNEEAFEATYTEENVASSRKVLEYLQPYANPLNWLPMNDEEASRENQLRVELRSYAEEELSKFLLGQKPMSEWDGFVEGLKQMGVDELLGIYDAAYKRVAG